MTALNTPARPFAPAYPPPRRGLSPDRSRGWLRRALPLLLSHRRLLLIALASALASTLLVMRVPQVLDHAVTQALTERSAPLAPYVYELLVLSLLAGVTSYWARSLLMQASYGLEYDLRNLLYEQLTRMSAAFYDHHHSGQLLARASSDIRTLQQYLSFGPLMIVQFFMAALAFGFMVTIDLTLTLVVMSTLPAAAGLAWCMRGTLAPASWLVQSRLADVTTTVDEAVQGVQVVRAFAAEDRELEALEDASARLVWAYRREADLRARLAPLLQNLSQFGLVAIFLVGGYQVLAGRADVGSLLAFASYTVLLQGPFQALAEVVMLGQRAAASASRVYEVLDQEPTVADRPGAVDLVMRRGDVALDGVYFSYRADRPVIRNLSLQLRRGETVALVGRSGSGKSTVARLLTRAYDVDAGSVRLDGKDVRDLTLRSLRRAVGIVSEEPFLFSASVRENIAYGLPGADLDQVRRAARAAGVEEVVKSLPHGYDTVLGERGYTLSGGQRQRIALARTVLADPDVVVLDDATSSLDVEVEAAVHEALTGALRSKTVLMIAHRVSTIALANRVVLLQDGRAVAEGTHPELLRNCPAYRDLLDCLMSAQPPASGVSPV